MNGVAAGGTPEAESQRLEALWAGEFGDAYTDRNAEAWRRREPFWRRIVERTSPERVLEVGCNAGPNLRWLAELIPPRGVFGVDVNEEALRRVRNDLPEVNVVHGSGRQLPFRDRFFDLVFTTGVLIHIPPFVVPVVMSEIVRCSGRYVLCGEYHAEEPTEVPYRGQQGALFKRDFGALYVELFPELVLVERGQLTPDEGWDDVTWWLLERR